MRLTKAGWPRPIIGGLPIPWVSPADDLASMNASRAGACATGAICAVCGEGYQDAEHAFALVKAKSHPASRTAGVQAMDNAVMHERCIRLALKVCPKLAELRAAGNLQIVGVPGNAATPIMGEDEAYHTSFPPEDVEQIDIGHFTSK